MTRRPGQQRKRARFSVTGAIIELLTIAALVFGGLFAWKLWWQPLQLGAEQNSAGIDAALAWADAAPAPPAATGGVPVRELPGEATGEVVGVLYAPALGADYSRPIVHTVDEDELMSNLGMYPQTAPFGAEGSTALAGHRTGWGDPFIDLPRLQLGDRVTVETVDGWYVYEYRTGSYVSPWAVEVLAPAPEFPGAPVAGSGDRVLTLQTCNPPYRGGPERFIAYAVFREFVPRAEGAPEDVAGVLERSGR